MRERGCHLVDINCQTGEAYKYKNTSDKGKDVFKKETLYGLNWAKTEASKLSEIVVCEGYTDVIGAHLPE